MERLQIEAWYNGLTDVVKYAIIAQIKFYNLSGETMEIITDMTGIEGLWAVDEFLDAYRTEAKDGLVACALAVEGGETGSPYETAIAVIRVAIQKSTRAMSDQKFVVGLSFYGFGDMMTIDVVSLDEEFHRDAIFEHSTRLNYIMPHTAAIDKLTLPYHIPFVYGGAHLKVDGNYIETFGGSGDYGAAIFNSNAATIADFAFKACGLTDSVDTSAGMNFIQSLLDFMLANKRKANFYEEFVESQIMNGTKIASHQFGGLLAMKASDRVKNGEGDILQMLVDELTGGLTKSCFALQVAAQMQSK